MSDLDKRRKNAVGMDMLPDEAELEALIRQELPESPLIDHYAQEINPFRDAVTYVITGQVLTTITVHFFYLQYILPIIGVMLTCLGMRTLRRGNRFFFAGWILSMISVGWTGIRLLLAATPYLNELGKYPGLCLGLAGLGLTLLFLFCFGKGIQQAGREAAQEKPKMPTLSVMIWQIIVAALAMVSYNGWVLMIAMIAAWIYMIRYICHCADDLQTVGYDVPAAPVRFSKTSIMLTYLVVLVAALIGLNWGFYHTPLEEQGVPEQGQEQVRAHLAELGFEKEDLDGILDEDLADLEDAEAVIYSYKKDQDEEAKMEGKVAAVRLRDGRIKCFTTFRYMDGAHSGLVDSVKLQYTYGKEAIGAMGRIFYTRGGDEFMAKVPLKAHCENRIWFGEVSQDRWLAGKYSYPAFSKGQRGYFTWWIEEDPGEDLTFVMACANFYNLTGPIVLPYVELPYQSDYDMLSMGFGGLGKRSFQIYGTPQFEE